MTELASLFNTDGKLAVQLNVGPLVVPLTRAQYNNSNKKLYPQPPKLFSHNDQQSTWQSSSPEGSTVGWGGNIGDLVLAQNSNSLFTCISVSGNAVFLSGDTALQYQVSTNGAVDINSVTGRQRATARRSVKAAMAQLAQQARGHALENEYNRVTKRAVEAEGTVTSADRRRTFADRHLPGDTGLGDQLAMVARLIRGRTTLGAKRQVFFVSMGGFDLHDNLIANQPGLMKQLSDAMAAFHRQMVAQGMADKVTAFTASDFGRTLASNGDGSDHGWGSHHFIVGGAVKGKQIYGTPQVGQHQQRLEAGRLRGPRGPGPADSHHLGRPVRRHARQAGSACRTRNLAEHPAEPQELRRQRQRHRLPEERGLHGLRAPAYIGRGARSAYSAVRAFFSRRLR